MQAGHGLDNLQSRLLTIYGVDAALSMDRVEGGMCVTISIPVPVAQAAKTE